MNMKKILSLIAIVALVAVSAQAQFHGTPNYSKDILGGNKITLATLGTTNITTLAYIGKDGFNVTPVFVGTNAGTANLAILATPAPDGVVGTQAATAVGNVAMNGTTVVHKGVQAAGTMFYGTGLVQITLTNAHTDSLTISNVYVGAW